MTTRKSPAPIRNARKRVKREAPTILRSARRKVPARANNSGLAPILRIRRSSATIPTDANVSSALAPVTGGAERHPNGAATQSSRNQPNIAEKPAISALLASFRKRGSDRTSRTRPGNRRHRPIQVDWSAVGRGAIGARSYKKVRRRRWAHSVLIGFASMFRYQGHGPANTVTRPTRRVSRLQESGETRTLARYTWFDNRPRRAATQSRLSSKIRPGKSRKARNLRAFCIIRNQRRPEIRAFALFRLHSLCGPFFQFRMKSSHLDQNTT